MYSFNYSFTFFLKVLIKFLKSFYLFVLREREKAWVWTGGGAEGEGDWKSQADKESQAGSVPPAQSPTWVSNAIQAPQDFIFK